MTDKEKEELATVLLLVIGDRSMDDVAAALRKVYDGRMWKLRQRLNTEAHIIPICSASVDQLHERLEEGYMHPDGKAERFKSDVTDAQLYAELDTIEWPEIVYEAIGDVIDEIIEDYRAKGMVEEIPPEVTQDVPHPTS